jgi:hypothetical protein
MKRNTHVKRGADKCFTVVVRNIETHYEARKLMNKRRIFKIATLPSGG